MTSTWDQKNFKNEVSNSMVHAMVQRDVSIVRCIRIEIRRPILNGGLMTAVRETFSEEFQFLNAQS